MRCDELSHSNERLYQWKVRRVMASLHWLAARTPYHDPKAVQAYAAQLHALCVRYLKDARVLDVGCGPGEQAKVFLKDYGARGFVGVDNSRGMVSAASAAKHEGANVTFVQSTALHLPFADGSFDVVHSRAMFHHIAPDARVNALREQLRVARRWVVLEDLTSLPSGLLSVLHRIYYTVLDGSYYRYRPAEWHGLVDRSGGEVVDLVEVGSRVLAGRYICLVIRARTRKPSRAEAG